MADPTNQDILDKLDVIQRKIETHDGRLVVLEHGYFGYIDPQGKIVEGMLQQLADFKAEQLRAHQAAEKKAEAIRKAAVTTARVLLFLAAVRVADVLHVPLESFIHILGF